LNIGYLNKDGKKKLHFPSVASEKCYTGMHHLKKKKSNQAD